MMDRILLLVQFHAEEDPRGCGYECPWSNASMQDASRVLRMRKITALTQRSVRLSIPDEI